ncbi:MAG: hypothetical protein OEL53_04465 [Rhodospirillales bacterium]|nr:hypothetical protein [Rhodospirillales bacterium]
MPTSISPEDLHLIQYEADAAARRLRRTLGLSPDDTADLRQELLLDVIARLRSFDPARGSLGAFVGTVMAHRASRLAAQIRNERRHSGGSLDEPLAGADGGCRVDLVGEEDRLATLYGQPTNAFAAIERRIEIERGLGCLDRKDRVLCAALSHATPDQLAIAGRGVRSSLYRRVREIRFRLMAVGLQAA